MTQTPPNQPDRTVSKEPEIVDAVMSDVDTPRGPVERGPDVRPEMPPRQYTGTHPHAQAAASAVTTVKEKFVSSFWSMTQKPETRPPCSTCGPETRPMHHQQPPIHELPALPQERLESGPGPDPIPRAHHEEQVLQFFLVESKLRQRIAELETELANAPSPDSVRALERAREAEMTQRELAQQDVHRKNNELDVLRKRWKQAARELDKARSNNQGFYQVTDNYLIELASRLRYNIRNFSIQYFGGDLKGKPKVGDKPKCWDAYMAPTTPGSLDCETFLLSSERRPGVIQGFIWQFLVGEVFDHFRWAAELGITLRNCCLHLRPGEFAISRRHKGRY